MDGDGVCDQHTPSFQNRSVSFSYDLPAASRIRSIHISYVRGCYSRHLGSEKADLVSEACALAVLGIGSEKIGCMAGKAGDAAQKALQPPPSLLQESEISGCSDSLQHTPFVSISCSPSSTTSPPLPAEVEVML